MRGGCVATWRRYSFDVMPMDGNTVWFGHVDGRHGLCHVDGRLGHVPFHGRDAGGCVAGGADSAVFGGFDMLLARSVEAISAEKSAEIAANDGAAAAGAARFRGLVTRYLTAEDGAMLAEVTGVTLESLLAEVGAAAATVVDPLQGTSLVEAALSATRFVVHPLNAKGLHLLRVLLAERMQARCTRDAGRDPRPVLSEDET